MLCNVPTLTAEELDFKSVLHCDAGAVHLPAQVVHTPPLAAGTLFWLEAAVSGATRHPGTVILGTGLRLVTSYKALRPHCQKCITHDNDRENNIKLHGFCPFLITLIRQVKRIRFWLEEVKTARQSTCLIGELDWGTRVKDSVYCRRITPQVTPTPYIICIILKEQRHTLPKP